LSGVLPVVLPVSLPWLQIDNAQTGKSDCLTSCENYQGNYYCKVNARSDVGSVSR